MNDQGLREYLKQLMALGKSPHEIASLTGLTIWAVEQFIERTKEDEG